MGSIGSGKVRYTTSHAVTIQVATFQKTQGQNRKASGGKALNAGKRAVALYVPRTAPSALRCVWTRTEHHRGAKTCFKKHICGSRKKQVAPKMWGLRGSSFSIVFCSFSYVFLRFSLVFVCFATVWRPTWYGRTVDNGGITLALVSDPPPPPGLAPLLRG